MVLGNEKALLLPQNHFSRKQLIKRAQSRGLIKIYGWFTGGHLSSDFQGFHNRSREMYFFPLPTSFRWLKLIKKVWLGLLNKSELWVFWTSLWLAFEYQAKQEWMNQELAYKIASNSTKGILAFKKRRHSDVIGLFISLFVSSINMVH